MAAWAPDNDNSVNTAVTRPWRRHVHDWFPIFVLVVVCVLVYAFNVHV